MPAKPAWFLKLPQILADLKRLDTPVLDRLILENLFGVRRRQAITLMHQFAGYQSGKTFLIDRAQLIGALQELRDHDDFGREHRRKLRLSSALDELRRLQPAIRIPISPAVHTGPDPFGALPPGVDLQPGILSVQFATPEELLGKLFLLAQNIAADFGHFRRISSHP